MTDKTADDEITARAREIVNGIVVVVHGDLDPSIEIEILREPVMNKIVTAIKDAVEQSRNMEAEAAAYENAHTTGYAAGILEGKRQAALCRVVGPSEEHSTALLDNFVKSFLGESAHAIWTSFNGNNRDEMFPEVVTRIKDFVSGMQSYRDHLTLSPIDVSSILPSEIEIYEMAEKLCEVKLNRVDDRGVRRYESDNFSKLQESWLRIPSLVSGAKLCCDYIQARLAGGQG